MMRSAKEMEGYRPDRLRCLHACTSEGVELAVLQPVRSPDLF